MEAENLTSEDASMMQLEDDPEIEAALQTLIAGDGDTDPITTKMMMMMQDETDGNAAHSHSDGDHHSVSPSTIGSDRYVMTGRPPQMLYLSCDGDSMTPYQQLLRKQIEFFEADSQEVRLAAQGRNKPIVIGQVGIRCRHCAFIPTTRGRGAVYFPSKLENIYQMAQNMANTHFVSDQCPRIPSNIREELLRLRDNRSIVAGSGKASWAEKAKALGVYEDSCGLRYKKSLLEGFGSH